MNINDDMKLRKLERDHYDKLERDLDRLMEAQEVLYEMALERAQAEFAGGELDDQIRDNIADECIDAANMALHLAYPDKFYRPTVNIASFMAMVEGVIEDRAKLLMEEGL